MHAARFIFSFICILLGAGSLPAEQLPWEARSWKNSDGKEIKARLVKWEGSAVTLRLENGKDAETAVNFLSPDDQKYLAKEKDDLAKMLKAEVAKKVAAAPKPASAPAPKDPKAARAAAAAAVNNANKPVASLTSVEASRVYRLGVPVPSPGSGTIAKVRGKVVDISSIRESSIETIIVELEGGLCLSAGSHEAVWGGSKQKLRVESRALIKYPQQADPNSGAKTSAASLAPVKLFGLGDEVTLVGRLHFAEEKVGGKSGFFARGYDLLTGPGSGKSSSAAKPAAAPAKPAVKKPDPKMPEAKK